MKAERNIATGMTEGKWAEHLWRQLNVSEDDKQRVRKPEPPRRVVPRDEIEAAD